MRLILFLIISLIYPIDLDQYIDLNDMDSNQTSEDGINDEYFYIENIPLDTTINPDEYKIGPGDKLSFNMISSDGSILTILLVSPTGNILIPNIGNINVDNLILTDAIKIIKNKCLEKYSNAEIFINLTSFREFNVKVLGPGINKGFLTVSPVYRLSNIFSRIMSESKFKYSMRDIKITKGDVTKSFDLLDFFVFGNDYNNPFIERNDIINLTLDKKTVKISGAVNITGIHEIKKNQNLHDLISISGGFRSDADSNFIEITRFIDENDYTSIKLTDFSNKKDFILKDYDDIRVRALNNFKSTDYITIGGQVKFPGKYLLSEVTTYQDVINLAGGFTEKADTNELIINNKIIQLQKDVELERILLIPQMDRTPSEKAYLKARKKIKKGSIRSNDFNFSSFVKINSPEIGDEIIIREKIDYIEIIGAVKHPGRYSFKKGENINSYIKNAGGLSLDASRKKYLIKSSDGKRVKLSNKSKLESGDIIFISSKEDFNEFQRFKEVLQIIGNFAALIAVIQNVSK